MLNITLLNQYFPRLDAQSLDLGLFDQLASPERSGRKWGKDTSDD